MTREPTFCSIALCAVSLTLVGGCTRAAPDELSESTAPLTSGAKRAASGAACTDDGGNKAKEADCLTVASSWGMAGAKSTNQNNGDGKLAYTGIDADAAKDKPLITAESAFAKGFSTTDKGKSNGGVYGAHGDPGWIQGLPDTGANGTILNEKFGTDQIPMLGLSVCYAGNTGADASVESLADTPAVFKNNIAAASFITTYFGISSDVIIGCKNGVVSPSGDTLWCLQKKFKRAGGDGKNADVLADATLIKGDGTERGHATQPNADDDDAKDFKITMQAAVAATKDTPAIPARYFKARNFAKVRAKVAVAPWTLPSRCDCSSGICSLKDNYPALTSRIPDGIIYRTTSSGSGDGGGSGGPGLTLFTVFGRYLIGTTGGILIQQPDGSIAVPTLLSVADDGSAATFTFAPTQDGLHWIRLTDAFGLQNDPTDPEFPAESFVVQPAGTPPPPPPPPPDAGADGGSGMPPPPPPPPLDAGSGSTSGSGV
jgi:hypothetical protein